VKWRLPGIIIILFLLLLSFAWWRWQGRWERSQDGPIREAALRYGVEPALVKAIVWRESRFNPRVHGSADEIGLMQIRDEAAQEWADAERVAGFEHEHCYNPVTNILAGTWYLRKLLKRYSRTDNPVPYALADYNAGRGNVLKWIGGPSATNSGVFIQNIGFPGTRAYVVEVMDRSARYRRTLLMAERNPRPGPPP
jgi:soluble lytic murein transglycosylase